MMTLLIIIGIVVVIYLIMRPRRDADMVRPGFDGFGGAGSFLTGMILGYLLERYLIDQNQYDMWSNLGFDELRDKLTAEGILDGDAFDSLAGQLSSTDTAYNGEQSDWESSTGYSDPEDYTDYSDSGDYGDSGGDF